MPPDMGTFQSCDVGNDMGAGKGNAFYVNQQNIMGRTRFIGEAGERGVEDTYWGWGIEFVDIENDGDPDLVAVTGFDRFVNTYSEQTASPHIPDTVCIVYQWWRGTLFLPARQRTRWPPGN